MNLFLAQTDICIDENFILPKSMHVCMIRFEGMTSIARGGEGLMIIQGCAREEREVGAREEEEIIKDIKKDVQAEEAGADYPAHSTPDYPALDARLTSDTSEVRRQFSSGRIIRPL